MKRVRHRYAQDDREYDERAPQTASPRALHGGTMHPSREMRHWSNAGFSFGLPHSMYSLVVSGSDASSIVLITSTNGTCATTALNRSGRMFVTAPMSRPPADPPSIISRSDAV